MGRLRQVYPALSEYIIKAKKGNLSIDFANPKAVKTLNAALLAHYYNVLKWDIPPGYLCPPIPGRADYIHGIADLLASCNNGRILTGKGVKGLDIGVGANGVYPIIGSQSYGWAFVGSDIDKSSIENCEKLVQQNPTLKGLFTTRYQANNKFIFNGVVKNNDDFAFSMCNPPFHKSAEEAKRGTTAKTEKLARNQKKRGARGTRYTERENLNFAGQSNELWCAGGELAFIQQMIKESVQVKDNIAWFTCLVSKSAHLKPIATSINYYGATCLKQVDMGQGQKKSRFVAWTFR